MIVRNEAHVITSALDSLRPYIDSWVIVDTGSVDGTQEVVRAYFAAHAVPGELHERPWRSFGANRTEALALARGKADYVWVMDADDLFVGSFDRAVLTHDCYHLRFGPDFIYWRPQIFRASLAWAYRGVVHEYAACLEPPFTEGRLEGDYYVESRRLGDRNRSPDKYRRDCALLLDALEEDPADPRTVFYLAQSYFDAGDTREALRYYTRRTEMGGFAEEVYYALFRRAVCLEQLGEPWERCRDAYLAASRSRPCRAEPLHALARREREEGRYETAYGFARSAFDLDLPTDDALFVAADIYKWRSADELAITAYYTGRYRESLAVSHRLLESSELPDAARERVAANRDFAAARLLEEDVRYPRAVVSRIVETARRASESTWRPDVTLTVTTCRRPHLFAMTIDSFLACCEDVDRVGRWIVVDDGSSDEDRAWMEARYPFFEFVWKARLDKGHARSLNAILDRLDSPYWLHLEDDWRFFVRDRYVEKALAILEDDESVGQVLFNRNYGETLKDRLIPGGIATRTGHGGLRYRLHEHVPPGTPEYAEAISRVEPGMGSMYYWPHYSLRPSLVRAAAVRDVGRYEPDADHFEHEFAVRYSRKGWRSAFFDQITAQHIGRLTSGRGTSGPPNAYELNAEPQFGGRQPATRVTISGTREISPGSVFDGIVVTEDANTAEYLAVFGPPAEAVLSPGRTLVLLADEDQAAASCGALDRRAFMQVRTPGAYRSDESLLQTIARVIHGREALDRLPVKVLNLDRRPDRWASFRRAAFKAAGAFAARCERVPAVDGRALSLSDEIRQLFRGNDFNYRRGIVGCALSHLAIWKSVDAADAPALVFEDDARLEPDFLGRLAEVLGDLRERHADFDLVMLGWQAWTDEQCEELSKEQPLGLRSMEWAWYLGGCFAYLVSPRGARKLLERAASDGIQNGIDWFVMNKGSHLKVLSVVPQLVTAPLAVPGSAVDSDIQHDHEPVHAASSPSAPAPRSSFGSLQAGSTKLPTSPGADTLRVKLIGDWCTSEELCREWGHMSKGGLRWNDIEVTWEDRDVDFYAIVNRPMRGEYYDPSRTIVFQMEPWCGLERQTWGVKTWGEWATPDPAAFLQVRRHATHLNNAFWQLKASWGELKTMRVEKTRVLSTICSRKYFDPGHMARVDFIRYLESRNDEVVRIDTFGWDNELGFKSYRGPHPVGYKDHGLLPYKYFLTAENNFERNFVTEKLWEPLLTETLCFYAGAPNAADHVDPGAFIPLDLTDFEQAFEVMRRAIRENEWERRLEVIRREKHRVLDEHQLFPTLERVLQRDFGMPFRPSDDEVAYRKYFHAVAGRRIGTACFIHSATFRGDTRILRRILDAVEKSGLLSALDCLYVVNLGNEISCSDLLRGAGEARPEFGESGRAKIHVVNYSRDVRRYERATLDLVRRFARVHSDSRILYLHTKGASYDPPDPHVADWTDYLLHFLVHGYEACLSALDGHDVVGCNRRAAPQPHFSGNFWWATARHLAALPAVPAGSRHEAEFWVLGRHGTRSLALWESGVNHYESPYPRERYAGAAV